MLSIRLSTDRMTFSWHEWLSLFVMISDDWFARSNEHEKEQKKTQPTKLNCKMHETKIDNIVFFCVSILQLMCEFAAFFVTRLFRFFLSLNQFTCRTKKKTAEKQFKNKTGRANFTRISNMPLTH